MECIKCGRETDQTFCLECREKMRAYPVDPRTVVKLPNKPDYSQRRNVRRSAPVTPEMKIEQLKLRIRRLLIAVLCLFVVIVILCTESYLQIRKARQPLPGQNYSVVHETEAAGN